MKKRTVIAYTADYNSDQYNGGPIQRFNLPKQQEELNAFVAQWEQSGEYVQIKKIGETRTAS